MCEEVERLMDPLCHGRHREGCGQPGIEERDQFGGVWEWSG